MAARERGRLLGIGISTMTEPLGAGNSREYDILGIKMFDSAELRVHMTGKAILRTGAKTQGQGHETTWAQIVSHELGIPADDVIVEEGDTDTAPFGMGTYASRSTPVAGAAVAMVARKVRAKARKLAAHLLEVSEEDVEWELGRFYVRGAPERGATIQECAAAAYSNMPDGMEPGLENNAYYDPPNLTWPFAVYIVTVEVDPETGVWDVLRVVAVDDCGVRINPMIVEGQIMGGLTEAYAMSNMQFQTYDADGNQVGSNYMDYLLPDRVGDARLRAARGRHALPAPPHRGQGRRRVRGGRRARGVRQRGARRAGVDRACATSTCRCCPTGSGRRCRTARTCPAHRPCGATHDPRQRVHGRRARRPGVGVLPRRAQPRAVPAGRHARRGRRRRHLRGQGRGGAGPGEAELLRHRARSSRPTRRPTGWCCKAAGSEDRGRGEAEMTITATMAPARAAARG